MSDQTHAIRAKLEQHGWTVYEAATGAMRSAEPDAYRFDLIPERAMRRLAATLREGAVKYSDHNWRKGFPWSNPANHALQHLYRFLAGDTSEDHLGHAMANLAFLIEFEETHPELDDRYKAPGYAPDFDALRPAPRFNWTLESSR
jgi:hypothetical protein